MAASTPGIWEAIQTRWACHTIHKVLRARKDHARILHALCKGQRIGHDVPDRCSKNAICVRLAIAGKADTTSEDRAPVYLPGRNWQVDELWSFVGAREKNECSEQTDIGSTSDAWI